jgi:hypothetical protein
LFNKAAYFTSLSVNTSPIATSSFETAPYSFHDGPTSSTPTIVSGILNLHLIQLHIFISLAVSTPPTSPTPVSTALASGSTTTALASGFTTTVLASGFTTTASSIFVLRLTVHILTLFAGPLVPSPTHAISSSTFDDGPTGPASGSVTIAPGISDLCITRLHIFTSPADPSTTLAPMVTSSLSGAVKARSSIDNVLAIVALVAIALVP